MERLPSNELAKRERLIELYRSKERALPFLRVNFVMSADGAATLGERSGGLGGETDRMAMEVLRMMSDVVIVGAGTVRAEGYGGLGLSEEATIWRREHGLSPHPLLTIVSDDLDLTPDMSVFTSAEQPPMVVTHEAASRSCAQALEPVADVVRVGTSHVDIAGLRTLLTARGYTRLLCEGGPHLFGSLIEAGIVDELCLTLSPTLVGGQATRIAVTDAEVERSLRLAHALVDDDGFVLLRYGV